MKNTTADSLRTVSCVPKTQECVAGWSQYLVDVSHQRKLESVQRGLSQYSLLSNGLFLRLSFLL